MAKLKCWKKIGKNKWNLRKSNEVVSIFKYGKRYSVEESIVGGSGKILSNKKSKPQAIKFAKSYMKKHDKCGIK